MYDAETDISMFVSAFYCLKKRGGESKTVFAGRPTLRRENAWTAGGNQGWGWGNRPKGRSCRMGFRMVYLIDIIAVKKAVHSL